MKCKIGRLPDNAQHSFRRFEQHSKNATEGAEKTAGKIYPAFS